MIKLHRLNKKEFVLNADLIRYVESTPDTLITLDSGSGASGGPGSGDKLMVLESVEEVVALVKAFRYQCMNGPVVLGKDQ